MQNSARLIRTDARDEEAIGLADDPLREFRAFGGRLAGCQDHFGEPVTQSAVVIELSEVQVLVRQCAQPLVGPRAATRCPPQRLPRSVGALRDQWLTPPTASPGSASLRSVGPRSHQW